MEYGWNMDGMPMKIIDKRKTQLKTLGTALPRTDTKTVSRQIRATSDDRTELASEGRPCPRQVYRIEQPNPGLSGHGDKLYALVKRGFDVGACLVAAPFVLPLVLICALAVRCSSRGPIFFRQNRTGQGGHAFGMLKFRSMVVDAELQKAALKVSKGISGPDFKMEQDPRITRVGSLMRKTSLDELPQLWNVFKGDMSLVGPRPTSFGIETYQRWHAERLEVKPGLTGLWQIKARGDVDFDYRVRLDIAYVRQRSLSLDLWILLRTAPCVIAQRGAY
jgi:lipopolysaccharide/colanic/teichoic acid biosynthesis glycosyltransferase